MQQRSNTADSCIMLQSGKLFDFSNPENSDISVEDIAHGLAHTCRYAGQCDGFYSVAEHSVLVSQIAVHSNMAALFHDSAEAFIGDLPGPLKRLLPQYKEFENRIEKFVFERLEIAWPAPPEVKRADYCVMAAEQAVLMPAGTNEWLVSCNVSPADVEIRQLDPAHAKALFLARYAELRGEESDLPARLATDE
jgi:hypothetical protein